MLTEKQKIIVHDCYLELLESDIDFITYDDLFNFSEYQGAMIGEYFKMNFYFYCKDEDYNLYDSLF